MNKVILIGNLTRDPELTETQSGISVCRFSIAVKRAYTNGDGERETDFFNVTAWRGLGDNVAKYCRKGNKIAVSGSIQMRSYEDNQGVKRTAVDVIAQDIEFLTQKSDLECNRDVGHKSTRGANTNRSKPNLEAFDDDWDIPL